MPIKVRFTRIESNHENLRTNSVVGWLHTPLEVGETILVTAEPLNKSFEVRCVNTTEIVRIEGNRYHTKNSTYEIVEL